MRSVEVTASFSPVLREGVQADASFYFRIEVEEGFVLVGQLGEGEEHDVVGVGVEGLGVEGACRGDCSSSGGLVRGGSRQGTEVNRDGAGVDLLLVGHDGGDGGVEVGQTVVSLVVAEKREVCHLVKREVVLREGRYEGVGELGIPGPAAFCRDLAERVDVWGGRMVGRVVCEVCELEAKVGAQLVAR